MSSDGHIKQGKDDDSQVGRSSNVADEEGMTRPSQKRKWQMAGEDMVLNVPETTVRGQMKINPGFTIEQAKAAAKKGKAPYNCF